MWMRVEIYRAGDSVPSRKLKGGSILPKDFFEVIAGADHSLRQSEMIESVAALKAAASAADKAKLEALERQLGITSAPDDRGEGSSSGKRNADVDLEELARKKHRFDDNEFLEQSREINDNVRNAVAAGKY